MKKKAVSLILLMLIFIISALPAFAAEDEGLIDLTAPQRGSRLVDAADLLTDAEEAALLAKLDEISERQQFDVVVVTVNGLEGKTAMEYADDFFDYGGYGFGSGLDGSILLVSMEERDRWISTSGYGITALNDRGLEYVSDSVVPYLSEGRYYDAFDTYARMCDSLVTQAKLGEPYGVEDDQPVGKRPFRTMLNSIISGLVGMFSSLCATGNMKSKLRTITPQVQADRYVRMGGADIRCKNDVFLTSKIARVPLAQYSDHSSSRPGGGHSTVHTSSSGHTHGGAGGKF